MMETPQYLVQRINLSESSSDSSRKESYKFAETKQDNVGQPVSGDSRKTPEKPALTQVMPDRPAPSTKQDKEKGLMSRLFGGLFGNNVEVTEKQEPPAKPRKSQTSRNRSRSRPSGNNAGRQQQRRGSRRNENSSGNSQRRQGSRDQGGGDNRQSRSASRNRNAREKKQASEPAETGASPGRASEKKEAPASASPEE